MKRKIIHQLIAWKKKKNRKPLILMGVRQTGKTYILEKFGKEQFNHAHYLNFEEDKQLAKLFNEKLDPQHLIKKIEFYLNHTIDVEKDVVIFDEIQACKEALTSLKYFAEKMPKLALCSAGSLLGIHLNEGSYPVGKVDMLHMYPMTFEEFLEALDDQRALEYLKKNDEIPAIVHDHLWEKLKWYFVVGGLPEAVDCFCENKDNLFAAFKLVREKQNELKTAYFADIAKHSGKVNAMHIERIWHAIPHQMAKTQDGSAAKFRFKGVIPGIDRYSRLAGPIDWLKAAGLILKVQITNTGHLPFSAYTEEGSFKLLLFDVGMLGAMSELSPKVILDYSYGSYKGFFAENFVAQELIAAGQPSLYCWQEKRAEVEFLTEFDGKAVPLEVKSGWVTKSKSLWKFKEKYHAPFVVILSAHEKAIKEEVHRLPLYLTSKVV